ncbi:MAG: heavy metal transport/detoxification protein [Chryseolinea sp.]
METLRFKTNVKCDGCIAKVTPHLDEKLGKDNWKVDITDPAKVLTVKVATTEADVKDALAKAGYKAEKI